MKMWYLSFTVWIPIVSVLPEPSLARGPWTTGGDPTIQRHLHWTASKAHLTLRATSNTKLLSELQTPLEEPPMWENPASVLLLTYAQTHAFSQTTIPLWSMVHFLFLVLFLDYILGGKMLTDSFPNCTVKRTPHLERWIGERCPPRALQSRYASDEIHYK